MDVRYLLFLFLLVSCLPTQQVATGRLASSSGSTTGGTSGTTTGTATSTTWNYLGTLNKSLIIDVANLNNAYIVGSPVEDFLGVQTSGTLANFSNQNYCIVARDEAIIAGVSTIQKELRSRIVPISYYDFTAKRTVRVLRVDFNDVTNSNSFCSGSLYKLDTNGVLQLDASAVTLSTRDPSVLCPTCTSNIQFDKVQLFRYVSGSRLEEVSTSLVNISGLSLAVDPNNNGANNQTTCTQANCLARGFNCCLENQCVNDGAIRPSAQSLYPTQLISAEAQRLQNPLSYLNYPQLYYICASSIPTTSGATSGATTGTTTSGGGYDAAFDQLKKDYYCLLHLKNNKVSETFHLDLLTTPVPTSFTDETDDPLVGYPTDFECRTIASQSSGTMYYRNVAQRLYQTCGCNKSTLSDMITSCPAYDYVATSTDSSGIPTRIDCYTPPSSSTPNSGSQNVSVNSRSAPHRFYDTTGVERALPSTGAYIQEGDDFRYLDADNILFNQQSFGMNSILGQMTVGLDKAMPAKIVNIELDQVYLLTTTSGYYTPCPACNKDSWFSSFSAYPTSSNGTGLQAVGHTTERDTFSTNSTAGNYEDTIFGRACWIPPTMLPYSHTNQTSTQLQRLTRLKTQSALYANGYQRDWYGFNKGALIGSFDGVTWFAIGKGRIARSTSKKLYLAINAPFADLAASTLNVVNIQPYDGLTQATQVDYDPQYTNYHPYQNEAGNCQSYHMCSTDTDCITRLGWEYVCADVRDQKTQWPVFNSNAVETANTGVAITIDQILQQKRFPSGATKRCLYRGAGSLCMVNSNTISTDLNKKKTLTCAPNFYCANVSLSGVFNSKVSRYASALENIPVVKNHYFGKDANVLGRPLSYLAGTDTTSLPSDVRTALTQNLTQYEATAAASTGLCLPGKALPESTNESTLSDPYLQHISSDAGKRTDYLNQIGSCNSTLFTANRYTSCPVIGSDGNYAIFSTAWVANYARDSRSQNACGLDTLLNLSSATVTIPSTLTGDALSVFSPFKSVEAKTLATQTIVDPTLVRDACLRRAGQVCHTDLDCSPNKFHATQTDFFPISYFGNEAEKKFYAEPLICGQFDPKPLPTDTQAFKDYDMSKNRCCREVGNDLSTYTSDIPTNEVGSAYEITNPLLYLAPGLIPQTTSRYTRLASVESLDLTTANYGVVAGSDLVYPQRPILSAYQGRYASDANLIAGKNPQTGVVGTTVGANVDTENQWKTLNEANSESCCGGGWVRKFADGTSDWSRRDRVYLDVSNFRCINSRTPLISNPSAVASSYTGGLTRLQNLLNLDYGDYCKDSPTKRIKGGCAMESIRDSLTVTAPSANAFSAININTAIPNYTVASNQDYYFTPRSADTNSSVVMDFSSVSGRRNIFLRVPSYVSDTALATLLANGKINLQNTEAGAVISCVYNSSLTTAMFVSPTAPVDCAAQPTQVCCFNVITSGINRYFIISPNSNYVPVAGPNLYPAYWGTKSYGAVINGITNPGISAVPAITRQTPGSNSYYLKRLGLLELNGIPQITYQPLTCSDSAELLVPGIFKSNYTTITQFNSTSVSYRFQGSVTDRRANRNSLATEQVFAANDFKCCTPLGKTATSQNKCCSGSGQLSGLKYTCSLPSGTDLMVYFNRYVSNEGVGTTQPGGGLVEADFDVITGEPLTTAAIVQKINALGTSYCASKAVRQGGAFGEFPIEPVGTDTVLSDTAYGILDSSQDYGVNSNAGQTVDTGYNAFMNGFRWNHHLYCSD